MINIIVPVTNRTIVYNKEFENFNAILVMDGHRKGVSWARNEGTCKENYKRYNPYLLFSDDDVFWDLHSLGKMVKVLENNPDCSIAYCNWKKIFPDHEAEVRSYPFDPERLKRGNYISNMSLIRTKDFPGYDESLKRLNDWDLWLTMVENGCKAIWIDEVLFETQCGNKGISDKGDYEYWEKKVKKKHGI